MFTQNSAECQAIVAEASESLVEGPERGQPGAVSAERLAASRGSRCPRGSAGNRTGRVCSKQSPKLGSAFPQGWEESVFLRGVKERRGTQDPGGDFAEVITSWLPEDKSDLVTGTAVVWAVSVSLCVTSQALLEKPWSRGGILLLWGLSHKCLNTIQTLHSLKERKRHYSFEWSKREFF